MIMEEIQCGNLEDLMIGSKEIKTIDWKLRFRIIFQLTSAIKYLHYHDPHKAYVHLDIKPENILLTKTLNVKLADFGTLDVVVATGAKPTTKIFGANQYTPWYTAPERLQDVLCEVLRSMDVYSFSMICYEVITRQPVYADFKRNQNLLQTIVAGCGQRLNMNHIQAVDQKLNEKNSTDLEIFQILKLGMEECWCFEPQDRLTMNEVLKKLVEFAGSDNCFNEDLKSYTESIAKTLVHYKKHFVTLEIKKYTLSQTKQIKPLEAAVPLNNLLPPFFHAP